jgi:hypothetical protein
MHTNWSEWNHTALNFAMFGAQEEVLREENENVRDGSKFEEVM